MEGGRNRWEEMPEYWSDGVLGNRKAEGGRQKAEGGRWNAGVLGNCKG